MQYLFDTLRSFADSDAMARLMFVGLTAAAIAGLVMGLSIVGSAMSSPLRRRLREVTGNPETSSDSSSFNVGKMVEPLGTLALPKGQEERSTTQHRLIHAGYRSDTALSTYYAWRLVLIILLPGLVFLLTQFLPSLPLKKVLTLAALSVSSGFFGPQIFLSWRVDKRQLRLRRSFPDALDLLVVCVESGLGLAAAIQRVGNELSVSHPELAAELSIVNAEIRAGVDRMEALKNLASRTGLDDIRGLVTSLAQSMRFGTSIAETLRVYAEEFRDKRTQAAEETAAKIGTKLIFPLTFCLFPAFFLVAIGPAILKIMAALARF